MVWEMGRLKACPVLLLYTVVIICTFVCWCIPIPKNTEIVQVLLAISVAFALYSYARARETVRKAAADILARSRLEEQGHGVVPLLHPGQVLLRTGCSIYNFETQSGSYF